MARGYIAKLATGRGDDDLCFGRTALDAFVRTTARSRALWRPLTRCSARVSICGSSINTRASTEFIGSSGPTSQAVLAKNARRRSGRVEDFGMRAVWGLNVNLP